MLHVERSFTNRATKWRGSTTSVTVRLADPVLAFIDSHFDRTIRNRSEFLQHWAAVATMVMADSELADALEWALGREQAQPELEPAPPEPAPVPAAMASEIDLIHEAQLEALRGAIR
jgi:hypothetical protein